MAELNRKLRGWANYFCLGPVSKAYDVVNDHVTNRLRQWLCAKHKVQGSGILTVPGRVPVPEAGALPASSASGPQRFRGRKREVSVREPDAGKPPVRFDEREVETEHG